MGARAAFDSPLDDGGVYSFAWKEGAWSVRFARRPSGTTPRLMVLRRHTLHAGTPGLLCSGIGYLSFYTGHRTDFICCGARSTSSVHFMVCMGCVKGMQLS